MSIKKEFNISHLPPSIQEIAQGKATEVPFTGEFLNKKDRGMYHCLVCNAPLFRSDTKFDSGTGWPSFSDTAFSNAVELHEDASHNMSRVEVTCAKCGAHLGHLFHDAPDQETGMRYCINSCVLNFKDGGEEGPTTQKKA